MSGDTHTVVIATITLVVTIIGTGVTLGLILVPGQRELRRDVADLRERMARLEGLFEGFTRQGGRGSERREAAP